MCVVNLGNQLRLPLFCFYVFTFVFQVQIIGFLLSSIPAAQVEQDSGLLPSVLYPHENTQIMSDAMTFLSKFLRKWNFMPKQWSLTWTSSSEKQRHLYFHCDDAHLSSPHVNNSVAEAQIDVLTYFNWLKSFHMQKMTK